MLERNFGQRLKFLRSIKNLTQAALAEKAGVTVQYLGSIERGLRSPSFPVISRLCESLEVEPATLFLFSPFDQSRTAPGEAEPSVDRSGYVGGMGCFAVAFDDGREHWSASFGALLGQGENASRLNLESFLRQVRDTDRELFCRAVETARLGDREPRFEFRFRRRNGPERLGIAEIVPEKDASGVVRQARGAVMDVTELRQLMRVMLINRHELEEHVRERTLALSRNLEALKRESAARQTLERDLRIKEKIVDAASDPMAFIDREHRFQAVNAAYEALVGLDKADIVGRSVVEVLGAQAWKKHVKPCVNLAFSGEKVRRREWFASPGRGQRFLDVSYAPSLEHGRIVGLVLTAHDWTGLMRGERRQDEPDGQEETARLSDRVLDELRAHQEELRVQNEELREAQAGLRQAMDKYHNLFERMPLGYAVLDQVGRILEANAAFFNLTGRPRKAVCDKSILQFLWPEDRGLFPANLKAALQGATRALKARLTNPKRNVTVEMRLSPFSAEGFAQGIYANVIIQDVTEKEEYEARLRLSEAKFRNIIEKTPYGVSITDAEGRYEYVNPTYCDLYGYAPAELLGRRFTMVFPSLARDDLMARHRDCVLRKAEMAGEWTGLAKSGEVLDVRIDSAWFLGEDGAPRRAAFVLDLTERNRLERIKRDVDSIIRHDMKTPLNAIIGIPDILLEDDALTAQQRELLERVQEAGYRVLNQINFSLELYRIETGAFTLLAAPVNLSDILLKLARDIRSWRAGRRPEILLSVMESSMERAEPVFILGDEILTYHLFANLLKNAAEASPLDRPVTVTVLPGEPTRVRVHNAGVVPEAVRNNFFGKFVTHGKQGGAGLGTYSARLMAQAQNGSLTFETSEEAGTTLFVALPGLTRRNTEAVARGPHERS